MLVLKLQRLESANILKQNHQQIFGNQNFVWCGSQKMKSILHVIPLWRPEIFQLDLRQKQWKMKFFIWLIPSEARPKTDLRSSWGRALFFFARELGWQKWRKNFDDHDDSTTTRLDKKWHFFYALKYAVKWPNFFFNLFALKNDPIFFTIFLH